ncbi:sensor histidine kinase [Dactylosporangium sp. CS-047395]|uniref:sensor histidine kinase n=1 Tax=Dactylosporangium sp. CS-047395 TaxID=3239936 RepID=UPI003D901ED1
MGLELRMAQDGLPGENDDVRQAVQGHPRCDVSQDDLGPAIRTLARRSSLPVELRINVDPRLPEQIEVAAYYVISDALTNAAKHAQASIVNANVEAREACLMLVVRDDGIGGAYRDAGSGLLGLQDRVETLDGTFKVLSPPGRGTTLYAELPYDSDGSG